MASRAVDRGEGGKGIALDEEVLRFMSSEHPDRASIRQDPYPFYDRLRNFAPVYRTTLGPWLVSSYDAVEQLVRDPRWTRESELDNSELRLCERVFLRSLVFRDPPAHTRLRRILSPLFTNSAIERRRVRTREIANEILRGLRSRDQFDFREDFSSELPVRLICEFIGMPDDDRKQFESWAESVRILQERSYDDETEAAASRQTTIAVPSRKAVLDRVDRIAAECLDYFERFIEQKRRRPGEDLTSLLLATSSADDAPLSLEELVSMLIILHVGGHSTTTDAISNGQFHLMRQPAAGEALRQDPERIPAAVEEILRYEPPVTVGIPRKAPEEMMLGDTLVPEGAVVYPLLAAANRDERRFSDPHRFHIGRENNRHLSFSLGSHFCIGAPLGRQETQEALRLLSCEYPPLEPAVPLETLDWQDSLPHRGLRSLPVRWAA